jgi:hypothetical protein
MVIVVRNEVQGIIVIVVPLAKGAKHLFFGIQTHLLIFQVAVPIDICEVSWVIDRNECHLYEVGKGIVIPELYEVLPVMDQHVVFYLMRIGDKKVPIHLFFSSSSSEDIRLLVLDDEMDEGEGSETFFSVKVTCVKGEEVERVCIRMDPWLSWVERSLSCFFFW